MREGKSKKKMGSYFLGLLLLLVSICIPVAAGVAEGKEEYEIYPTPQSVTYEAGTTALTNTINVICTDDIDDYTKARIEVTLDVLGLKESTTALASDTKLIVGVYGSESEDAANDYAAQLGAEDFFTGTVNEKTSEKRFDKYILQISNGTIVILGEDVDAAYYGVTTLKHIFEQLKGKTIRNLTVKDYAEVEFRGFIEGYYGNPWSQEDRIDLMQYGGEIKLNQYVYAPKDDPLHNANWRTLYNVDDPESDTSIEKIKALAQAGNESKCFFVYALHPFMSNAVNLSDSTYDSEVAVVKRKFEQVIRYADVRQIAILEDDATGETAERMVRFLNDMNAWLKELKQTEFPDLKTDILYCPSCYMATTNAKLTTISNGVSDEIHIVMTGGKIWGEVSETFATSFYNGLGGDESDTARYPYMWVNWPCNDNTKNSQIMGGHNYILHKGIDGSHYEGIILNPIQESEPSKVGIFTAADYCWKVWQDEAEGDQAWEDAFKYIDHMTPIESDESNALREVARHMIRQGPDQLPGKQVEFDESLNVKDLIAEVSQGMENGTVTVAKAEQLRDEFEIMYNAASLYLKKGTNKRMVNQMTPFLSCFRDMTESDMYLLDALKASLEGNSGDIWENYAAAQALYERSQTYGFQYYRAGTLYATAGRKYIKPFTDQILKYISDEVKLIVDPERIELEKRFIFRVGGKTTADSVGSEGALQNATDGSLSTTYLIKEKQIEGDYVGMMFNIPVSVKSMTFSLTVADHENDYIAEGVMEYTLDGKNWQEFSQDLQPVAGPEIEIQLPEAMDLRGFRWRCTGLGGIDRWLGIKDVGYNTDEDSNTNREKYAATFSCTNYWTLKSGSAANMTDGDDGSVAYWDPSQSTETGIKDHSLVGEYIQLDLGGIKQVGLVRAVVGSTAKTGDKWTKYHLAYSENGTDWTSLDSYTDTSTGPYAYEVDLHGASARYLRLVNDLKVNKWLYFGEFEAYSGTGTEGEAMDYTNTDDTAWRVRYGEESSNILPRENVTLQPGQYIGLKLSRIRKVTNIAVEGSGMENLSLEKSMNGIEWVGTEAETAVRYVRLKNDTDAAVTFTLTSFVVESEEIKPMDLFATTIGNETHTDDARSLRTTRYWMDGDLTTAAKYCSGATKEGYVTYDLGQEIELRSLSVYVEKTSYDYPRDAIIQASLDNANWTNLVTIGDDVQDQASDDSVGPMDNPGGGWKSGEGAVEVIYAIAENKEIPNVKARYIRLYFTQAYSHRWIELNEIRINDGEFIPSTNDPTIETNVKLQRDYEPKNLTDGNLTTAFKPDGEGDGYLIYNLSDTTNPGGFNILQSGNAISNAKVSVRTGADEWKELGILDKSYSAFYTAELENVYAIKIEWKDIEPVIYEMIILENEKHVLDKYERDKQYVQKDLTAADNEVKNANAAVSAIDAQINAALAKINSSSGEEKLRAEVELSNLYVQKAEAEAVLAEKKVVQAEKQASVYRVVASSMNLMAAGTADAEKKQQYENQANQNESNADAQEKEAEKQQQIADTKIKDKDTFAAAAEQKKNELANYELKAFVYNDMNYEVLNTQAQTVTIAGPVDKNKMKTSITIPNTVTYDNKTWKVTEIKAGAFKGCKKLKSVKIGSNIQKIGSQAFVQCKNLKTVNMKKATKITSIAKGAFKKSTKAVVTVHKKNYNKYKNMLKKAGVSLKKIKK